MLAVTIAVSPPTQDLAKANTWRALATASAERMARHTGLRTRIITEDTIGCAHPSWLKCHIPDLFPREHSFLVFDADILCIRDWDPYSLYEELGSPFMAVPEPNENPDVLRECATWKLGYPDTYLNCGLMIFGRHHAPVLQRAWEYHPEGGQWLEQTAINRALVDQGIEVCRLPRRFNAICQQGIINNIYNRTTLGDAVNVHTCAMKDPEQILARHDAIAAYVDSGRAGRTRLDLLRELPQHSAGAEIGVFRGEFSRQILQIVKPRSLALVDLFDGIVISGDQDGRYVTEQDMSLMPAQLEALAPGVATVHRSDSSAWLASQPRHSLDWVYIDAAHDHDSVLRDLRAALHAVRPGGIIAGHDFSRAFEGVMIAVLTVAKELGIQPEIFDGDLLPSYLLRVP